MTQRVNLLDRPWADVMTSSLVGPVHVPGRTAIVDAIVELAFTFPCTRLGWELDHTAITWSWRPSELRERAEQMVIPMGTDPAVDYSAFLTTFGARRDLALPASFVTAPGHFGMRLSHAVGDGRTITMLIAGVLSTASTGHLPDWPSTPGIRHPYSKALRSFFGRSPRRVIEAARAARPMRSGVPTQMAPWTPKPVTLYRRMSSGALAEVREWRKQHAPGASMPAVELALLLRAFRAVGVPLAPEVLTLFDVRRYLPRSHIDGNFVVGLLLPLSAHHSVNQVGDAMSHAGDKGRPLTALGMGLLTRRRPPAAAHEAPVQALPRLAFTHMGRPQAIERLEFLAAGTPVYIGCIDPSDPCGITVATTQTGRALHLSATMHENVVNASAVADALDLVGTEPIQLLNEEPSPVGPKGARPLLHALRVGGVT